MHAANYITDYTDYGIRIKISLSFFVLHALLKGQRVKASCSSLFATWIRFLGKFFGDAVIVWLPKDAIFSNLPNIFKGAYRNTRCIIDCSEIYIERPKSLNVQASTWSDYKKHNRFKFLIAIAPSGYITYILDCYGGRATDQFIC